MHPKVFIRNKKKQKQKKKKVSTAGQKRTRVHTMSSNRRKRLKKKKEYKNALIKISKQKHFCRYCEKWCVKGRENRNINRHNNQCTDYQKAKRKRELANARYAKKKKSGS